VRGGHITHGDLGHHASADSGLSMMEGGE